MNDPIKRIVQGKMTRYARAKGSKASNERLPNEATPWHVMKQQLEESKSKGPAGQKKSAKELLRDKEDAFSSNTNENAQEWAEFEDNRSKSNTGKKHKNSNSKKNLAKNLENFSQASESSAKKSQKAGDAKIETTDRKTTKLSNKKKRDVNNTNLVSGEKELSTPQDTQSNYVVLSKRQKRNQKRKLEMSNDGSKRFKKDTGKNDNTHTREEKMKRKGEYKRRKPDAGVTKVTINGVETEIVMFDRFPVKKEDAERLTELKQKMLMKGIPKSEVDMAMKLERRKAEKALARIRKLVCFNCRKSGHNLSDCPELDRNETCTGICFKCGSTEHTHFECKVTKDSTYRYAKCFICREQGHIANQCPDNPKGVYPHGGCCKVCGDVTHLKKDCPDLVNAKEESAVTVEKMDDSAVESLQEDTKVKRESNKPQKNKIIKF